MTDFSKLFIDTTPLIYYVEKNREYYDSLKKFFMESYNSGKEFITSVITVHEYSVHGKTYNGTTRKFGISINGTEYIIKLPKEPLSIPNEYVASNFIRNTKLLPCQEVDIGKYNKGM